MTLGTLDSTPIIRVNHKTGRFESGNKSSSSIGGRVMAIHYGRKKFAQVDEGKWTLECVSADARNGNARNGDSVQCMSSAWCADCKSTLSLVIATKSGGVIVETSASVAATIRDRLAPVISRGVAMDALVVKMHLGQVSRAGMNFAQCSVELLSGTHALVSYPRLPPEQLSSVMEDFTDYIRSSFSMRAPNTSRSDLSDAELSV